MGGRGGIKVFWHGWLWASLLLYSKEDGAGADGNDGGSGMLGIML